MSENNSPKHSFAKFRVARVPGEGKGENLGVGSGTICEVCKDEFGQFNIIE